MPSSPLPPGSGRDLAPPSSNDENAAIVAAAAAWETASDLSEPPQGSPKSVTSEFKMTGGKPAAKKGKGKKAAATKKGRKKAAKKWTAEELITNEKSPLATTDLRSIICNPAAWDILTAEEKAEVIALFPEGQHVIDDGTSGARPDFQSLRNDDTFRHDCAAYTENISEGRYDQGWLESAWSAHELRKVGGFDDFLINKFEEDWQAELPEDYKPKRQEAKVADSIEGGETEDRPSKKIKEDDPPAATETTNGTASTEATKAHEDEEKGPNGSSHLPEPKDLPARSKSPGKKSTHSSEKTSDKLPIIETQEDDVSPTVKAKEDAQDIAKTEDKPQPVIHKNEDTTTLDELSGGGRGMKRGASTPVRGTPKPKGSKRSRCANGRPHSDSEDELA